jgi:hypothetical protein
MSSIRKYPGTKDFNSIAQTLLSNAQSDAGEGFIVRPSTASGQVQAQPPACLRIAVESTGTLVWLAKPKGSNAWVVTGYEKTLDGAAAGRATAEPTSTAASLTRDSRVAEFQEVVAQDLENGNQDINFSRTSPIDAALKATVVTDITKAAGHKLADFRSIGLTSPLSMEPQTTEAPSYFEAPLYERIQLIAQLIP